MSTETPMMYRPAILELAEIYQTAVANAHQNLGLSQEGISSLAIHGAILEEFNDRREAQGLVDYIIVLPLYNYRSIGNYIMVKAL